MGADCDPMIGREFNVRSVTAATLSGFGMAFSTGPFVFSTFSLFMLPMASAFGWGRGEISAALLISSGCAALADPFVGRWVDRWGARKVLLPGMIAFGLANAGLYWVRGSLVGLYLLFGAVGATSALCAAVPYSKVISSWFQARRGLVLGVALGVGAGIGSAVMPHIAQASISAFGWRAARLALAGGIVGLGFPIMLFFLRENRREASQAQAHALPPGPSAAEARRDPTFWLMLVLIFVGTIPLAGTVVHLIALLADRGVSGSRAAAIYSAYAISNIVGHVLIGALQDRVDSPRVGLIVYASALLSFVMLQAAGDHLLWGAAIFLGLGFGAEVSLGAYWVSRYWGLRSYGEIYGSLYCGASAAAAIGPFVMGVAYDLAGAYRPALTAFQAAMVVCIVLTLKLKPYTFPLRR